jgi:hypothetical protein
MEFWTLILLGAVLLLIACPPRWDPAIRLKEWMNRQPHKPRPPGHLERWLDFIPQAREDQRKTDYPGCARGIMFCRSTVCGCVNESRPHDAFVEARARLLAKEEADG